MFYLKIDKNKGYFYSLDEKKYIEIDKITKEDLMKLLDLALDSSFEIEKFDKDKIANKAHKIIYQNIHDRFVELLSNKNIFNETIDNMYKDSFDKYSKS